MRRHPFRRFFGFLFRRAWWQPNRESRKMLRKEADNLIGWDKRTNPAWAKSWKYFIKRQFPWYGLLELIQYKIIEMRDYMQNHSYIIEEEVVKQAQEMTEVIDLGNKILADEYDKESIKFLRENSVAIAIVYKKHPENKKEDFLANYREELTRLYGHDFFEGLLDDEKPSKEVLEKREKYLAGKETRSLKEWLKDNQLTEEEIGTAYTSEWIDESYGDKWKDMMKKEQEEKQKDTDKYFKLLAERYYSWGD